MPAGARGRGTAASGARTHGAPPRPEPSAGKALRDVAYDALKAMILSGELRPGARLGERELARRIDVSRTPLREALGRLERDGLAMNKPGLGYFALEFPPQLVEELYEFRQVLEVHAARAAAERIGAPGMAELREILRQLGEFERKGELSLDELREEVRLGLRIHEVIARESGNRMIFESLVQVYDRLRLLTWIDVVWVDHWPLTRAEHRELVHAVLERDAERAARAAAGHIERCREDALWVIRAQHGQEESHVRASPGEHSPK